MQPTATLTPDERARLWHHVRAYDDYQCAHGLERKRLYADADARGAELAKLADERMGPVKLDGVVRDIPNPMTDEEEAGHRRLRDDAADRLAAWERANRPDLEPWDTPTKLAGFIDTKLLRGRDGVGVAMEQFMGPALSDARYIGRTGTGDRLRDALLTAERRLLAFAEIAPSVASLPVLDATSATGHDAARSMERIKAWCVAATAQLDGPAPMLTLPLDHWDKSGLSDATRAAYDATYAALWAAEQLAFWVLDAEKCRAHRAMHIGFGPTLPLVPEAAEKLRVAVTAAVGAVRPVRADLMRVSVDELPHAAGLTGDCAHGLALALVESLASACIFTGGFVEGGVTPESPLEDIRAGWLRLRPTLIKLSSADTQRIVMLMRREAVEASQRARVTAANKAADLRSRVDAARHRLLENAKPHRTTNAMERGRPTLAFGKPDEGDAKSGDAGATAAEADKLVTSYIARAEGSGRDMTKLTRDGIVAGLKEEGTPVSEGGVSGTKAWKQLKESKGRKRAPPPKGELPAHVVPANSPGVASDVEAAIESGGMDEAVEREDWEAVRRLQEKEKRQKPTRSR